MEIDKILLKGSGSLQEMPSPLPLVSVYVITYNSSKTVIETLESIKAQTYQNIELVVTDDNSPDNTVELCREWLQENGKRFTRTEFVTSDINTGIAENSKRGHRECRGEWIKCIAGDDLLVPSAIEDIMAFVQTHPSAKICITDVEIFSDDGIVPDSYIKSYASYFNLANQSYEKQWLGSLQGNIFVGPGLISNRDLYKDLVSLPKSYGNADEWPFFYCVLKSGYQIFAINKKLVRYRYSASSISHSQTKKGMRNKNLELSTCAFFFDHPMRDLLHGRHYLIAWDSYLHYKTIQLYYETDGATWAKFLMTYSKFLSPYGYWKRIRRIINKE